MAERVKKCVKVYILGDDDGTEVKHAASASFDASLIDRLEFRFANGNVHAVKLEDFDAAITRAAAWHGISQGLGDKFAQTDDADEAEEAFLTKLELYKEGSWITARVSGEARPSDLIQAVVNALLSRGDDVDDERRTAIVDKLTPKYTDGENVGKVNREAAALERKRVLANSTIKAEYDAIRAARAAAKAEASAKVATSDDGEVLDAF